MRGFKNLFRSGSGKRREDRGVYLLIAVQWRQRGAIGGMSQRFVQYAASAGQRGMRVRCLTSWSLANHLGLNGNSALFCIDDRRFQRIGMMFALIRFICGILLCKYSVVHFAGGGLLGRALLLTAKFRGIKTSCTFASRTLAMASYGSAEKEREWIRLLDASQKIDVLNPGNDLWRWRDKVVVSACSFPSRLVGVDISIVDKRPLIVFCGSLVHSKNPLLAIRIVDELRFHVGEARLVVFGGGPLRSECETEAALVNKRHGGVVIEFGKPEDYFATLSIASVFLSLQDFDNYPSQSLMEGMAFGCRCVCTSDGDTALMFPSGSDDHALIDSRDALHFVPACRRFINLTSPSKVNSDFIRENHTFSRFSEYFDHFLHDMVRPAIADLR